MYRLIMAVGVVAAICIAAGCGGSGGSEEEAASAPLTKAQFIKQADAICANAVEDREAAAEAWRKEQPAGSAETPNEIEQGLKEVIAPALQQQAEDLEALAAPAEDRTEVAHMISTLASAGQMMEQEPKEAFQSSIPKFEREAKDYGLESCQRAV
jgi:hypothetical protein